MSGLTKEELEANAETQKHIDSVRKYLRRIAVELLKRGELHDASKLGDEERKMFAKYTPMLKNITYGSPEYEQCRKDMKPALDHHYAKNRHHPEHFEDLVSGMNLIDVIELFCDWFASAQRHNDGNILKSIEHNKKRFGMSEELSKILQNTADAFDGEGEK
jgi:hypothetical protein